jgi:uncharacterized protein YukE
MVQAIVDPADVRRFTAQLRQHNNDLRNTLSQMNGQLQNLGETWRDVEYQKFQGEFKNAAQMIRRFTDNSDQYAQFLTRKAGKAEEYLSQR